MKFTDFFDAWWFLTKHKAFYNPVLVRQGQKNWVCEDFQSCLTIEVVKTDPITKRIEEDDSRNTKTQVWLECGYKAFLKDVETFLDDIGDDELVQVHDTDLDCGGDTFEEAIISLANLVDEYYNVDGKRKKDK